jgi:hypothetical protein
MPSRSRQRTGRALVMLAVTALLSLIPLAGSAGASAAPRPADCGLQGFLDQLGEPDTLVLVGTIDSRGHQIGDTPDSGFRYKIQVSSQIPDDADPTLTKSVTVNHTPDGVEPVARLDQGEDYFFAVTGKRDTFVAQGCAAALPYQDQLEREIEATIAGQGDDPGTPAAEPSQLTFSLGDEADDGATASFSRSIAPGLAITLLGILGLIAFAIAGRRST